jgi:hypothetical protein
MKILALAVTLMLISSAVAFAGANPTAKSAVHVQTHWAKQSCTNLPYITNCAQIVTTNAGCNIDAFPVFYSLTAYLGFEYGMCWDPPGCLSSCTFTNCADLVIGGIVWSGDGVSQTWFNCQYAYAGVPGWGWFYAYCPAVICICDHPQSGVTWVLDCWDSVDTPVCNFCAGVCGAVGDSPCDPTGTEQSTWGAIKSMFE